MNQHIIFTALPHKASNNGSQKLHASVLVTFKLSGPKGSTLNSFPDVLDWVAKVKNGTYAFQLNNGKSVTATLNQSPLDDTLSKAIFYPQIKVAGFEQEDLTVKRLHSYPVKHINDFVVNTFKTFAIQSPDKPISPFTLVDKDKLAVISRVQLNEQTMGQIERINIEPTQQRVANPIDRKLDLRDMVQDKRTIATEYNQTLRAQKFMAFSAQAKPEMDFAQFRDFHKIDKQERIYKKPNLPTPEFEFHDMLAIIAGYPYIQRKLGFVLDFTIDNVADFPADGTMHLVATGLGLSDGVTVLSTPSTAFVLSGDGFYAKPTADSVFADGFVKINTPQFTVYQGDIDGAAIKANNLADIKIQEVARFHSERVNLLQKAELQLQTKPFQLPEAPKEEGLPVVQSAGIAVARNGMAEHLHLKFQQATEFQTKLLDVSRLKPQFGSVVAEKVLYADDIVQGYRMDIAYADAPDKWFSLHQRKLAYTWYDKSDNPSAIPNDEADEGFVELALAEDLDDKDDVFVPETIARWEGWSLAVNRPGYAINEANDDDPDPSFHRDYMLKDKSQEMLKYRYNPKIDFKINAQATLVPGTLPRLRFGRSYNLRIRTVDLAGNSVPLSAQSNKATLTTVKNVRYMRFEPLQSPILLSGTSKRQGESAEHMVIRSNYNVSAADFEGKHGSPDHSVRYFMPPQNSQLIAENHGVFDKFIGVSPQAAKQAYDLIASLEGSYAKDDAGETKIFQPNELEVIYLPDPMAAGVAIFLAPGYESTHSQTFAPKLFSFFSNDELQPSQTNQPIPDEWYKAKHVRIRLEEGSEMGAKWSADDRQLTVRMPKGQRTMLKFSTFWREKDLKEFSAIWDFVKKENPSNLADIDKLAVAGQHWMVSPSRELELVHAVMQPLEEPVIDKLLPDRDFAQSFANLHIRFTVHGESTEKVAINASWTDPVDDGISIETLQLNGKGIIPDIDISYHDSIITKGTIPEPPKPDFKARQVRPMNQFRPRVEQTVFVTSRFHVQLGKQLELINLLAVAPLTHQFGDTKHRWVEYKADAISRYPSYFQKIINESKEPLSVKRTSAPTEKINILSSQRPSPVEIDYVVPTFEWRKSQTGNSFRHKRMGGGLRIFIKRPWYSSGADEMVGVVLPVPIQKTNAAMMQMSVGYTDLYTHWGIDPIRLSDAPSTTYPELNDFRHCEKTDLDIQYPDQEAIRANVAAYPVFFDKERQTWYCDVAIDPGKMYFPFIRLALARYQPHSVRKDGKDVCLSPIKMAPMMQLVPERQATLTFDKDDKNSRFTLTIEGQIHNDYRKVFNTGNYVDVWFMDTKLAQPIYGLVDDGGNESQLAQEKVTIPITDSDIQNSRFKLSKSFTLPGKYKTASFQVVIEEYETAPTRMKLPGNDYNEILQTPEERLKLVYADVFKINEVEK